MGAASEARSLSVFSSISPSLATVLFLVSAATAHGSTHGSILGLRADERSVMISDRIIMNTDSSWRIIVPGKCQDGGEIELIGLAGSSDVEEAYVFIPETCTWVEIGRNEMPGSVRVDDGLLREIASQYATVAVYHTQPGHHAAIASYFPAYRDFIAMTLIDADFLELPHIRIYHRAVTAFAIADYKIADRHALNVRAERYRKKGLSGFVGQNLAYEFNLSRYVRHYREQVLACIGRLEGNPSRIPECGRIAAGPFELQFRFAQIAVHR